MIKKPNIIRYFYMWQKLPHVVAPLSNTQCKCACCGTEYVGNFCPRCGQSASVRRFSLKQAFDLFLDVWDVNNRSVFRTMRDMLLRPGYMIRDYLNGMQAGYFSPFKMFFLLATLSLLVENGFFFKSEASQDTTEKTYGYDDFVNELEESSKTLRKKLEEDDTITAEDFTADTKAEEGVTDTAAEEGATDESLTRKVGRIIWNFSENNPALFTLFFLVLFSLSMYPLFRHCPRFPGLSFSEFVAALICTYNTYTLINIFDTLFHYSIITIIALFMAVVTLSQFSGYSKLRVFIYLALMSAFWFIVLIAIVATIVFILMPK